MPAPTPLTAGDTSSDQGAIASTPVIGFAEEEPVENASLGRFWTDAEFLMWITPTGPVNGTLLIAGTGSVPTPGQTGTVNFVSSLDFNYGIYRGMRLTSGYWFDPTETWGLEGNGFFALSSGFNMHAGASGTSVSSTSTTPLSLGRQYTDAVSDALSVDLVGAISFASGVVHITSDSSVWGLETNLVRQWYRSPTFRVELLAGLRYLNLTEDLTILQGTQLVSGVTQQTTIPGTSALLIDRFDASNHFVGPQIGARMEYHLDALTFTMVGKLAVGPTHEIVTIRGVTTFDGVNVLPGGLLALPSNIGQQTNDDLAFVPQFGFSLGYQPARWCRIFAGYDFTYWTHVVRPGSQIDPVVNATQVPSSSTFGIVTGPLRPAPLFNENVFWVQGVSIGFEIRY